MADAFQPHAFQGSAVQIAITDADTQLMLTTPDSVAELKGGTSTTAAAAQSFVSTRLYVSTVQVHLQAINTPADNVIVEIQTSASNLPSGTVVGSSPTFPAASVTTAGAGNWCDFAVAANVAVGVKYWIVARRSGGLDTTNYVTWKLKASGNQYTSGGRSVYNGTTTVWGAESATIDHSFIVWTGTPNSPPFAPRTQRNFALRR